MRDHGRKRIFYPFSNHTPQNRITCVPPAGRPVRSLSSLRDNWNKVEFRFFITFISFQRGAWSERISGFFARYFISIRRPQGTNLFPFKSSLYGIGKEPEMLLAAVLAIDLNITLNGFDGWGFAERRIPGWNWLVEWSKMESIGSQCKNGMLNGLCSTNGTE